MIKIVFDNDHEIICEKSKSILEIALEGGIYIPHLCSHPQLDPVLEVKSIEKVYQGGIAHEGEPNKSLEGCNLCLIEIEGRQGLFRSCNILAEDGMVVRTDSPEIQAARKRNLAQILEAHPHTCIFCKQAEGCDRKICSPQTPDDQRCCSRFGNCELQRLVKFIDVQEEEIEPYFPRKIPVLDNEPLFVRDYNLCVGCLRCVRVCKEIKGADALGFTSMGVRIVVGSKRATLKDSGCQFCGYCVEVCPTGALLDRDVGTGQKEKRLVPCKHNCPAEVDIPEYIRMLSGEQFDEALKVIGERIPLPGVLGRVCFHPCESQCRRGKLDKTVAICALKRAAADFGGNGFSNMKRPAMEETGKKVAIVGSGPAGLAAVYYLNGLGHSVTIFEALPVTGGMLRVGIPPFRLPRNILDAEIKCIEDHGVRIMTNHKVGSLQELFSDGFDAIFVAVGAHKGLKLGIPGDESEGVIDGIAFLRDLALGGGHTIGDNVAVIGGGNVATDSARSAIRKGAKKVTIFYRRTRAEMLAYAEEMDAAVEEGVRIEYQSAPTKIEIAGGALEVEFIRMEMGELDSTRRPQPKPIAGSEFRLRFDTVIAAIGQVAEGPEDIATVLSDRGSRSAELSNGIFLGGDCLTGPATVVDAIAEGRRGAILIDKFLGGVGDLSEFSSKKETACLWSGSDGVYTRHDRIVIPHVPAEERVGSFSEVAGGIDRLSAVAEARRCLQCDLRLRIRAGILPPERWMALVEQNIVDLPQKEGVYVIFNENKETHQITGTENLAAALAEELGGKGGCYYFSYEIDPMFTSRERQLIQQYMKKFGKMPPGNDDELF
jgi:NADPH-dependent glutamate synthase beta subunit-like oxidoreductase/Pyruvate/2-oxoacid:ferredoxin oxidoreductase delta subunit